MKIAFLVTQFPRISETFILNQITGLIDRGHNVDIYSYVRIDDQKIHDDVTKYNLMSKIHYYKENMPTDKIGRLLGGISLLASHSAKHRRSLIKSLNVFRFGKKACSLRLLYKIAPFVGRGDYDIVYCHFGPNGEIGALLKDLGVFAGKLITVFHGYDMSSYLQSHGLDVYNYLFGKGDFFLPISNRWKKELISLGCPEDKIEVHHMGIDPNRYTYVQSRIGQRDKIRVLSIGRFVEKKGIRYGVEAVGRIIRKHPEIEYWIAGDGELRGEVESVIDQMNLRQNIRLLGWRSQEEILDLITNSDIFLAPSVTSKDFDQEGIPVALMEAMAMGLPVISTHHSGIPELVADGVSGCLTPERDVNSLADALSFIIEHPGIGAEMGLKGRQIVEDHFNIEKLNDKLVKIFEGLLTKD